MKFISYMIYNFIFYSFLGWIIEEVYSYFITGRFKEDGFLYGPIKPMYGITMCIIIGIVNFSSINTTLKMILVFVVPALIEYTSGYMLRKLFHKEYWSYEKCRFNIDGLICLRFCIYWAILIWIALKTVVLATEYIFYEYGYVIMVVSSMLFMGFIIDFFYTIKRYTYKIR